MTEQQTALPPVTGTDPLPPVVNDPTNQTPPPPTPPEASGAPVYSQPESYEDYWGSDETFTYFLPDGKQYFTIRPMTEGAKAKFQKKTNKGIRVSQRTDDAHLDVDPAGERWQLIKDSVVDWKIMQKDPGAPEGWSPYPCPGNDNQRVRSIEILLEKFNPKVVQDLEFFIRTKNPWMQADMDIEEIDKEIERLYEVRAQVVEQKEGEGSSATK